MRRLLNILIVVALTLVVALVTPMLIKEPGYVYFRFAGYEIEMRFVVALGLVIAFVFLFWLVVYLWRLPKKTAKALSQNRSRKSFAKGLLALSEGRWKESEKLLLSSVKNSPTPELGYMAAARAAVSQNKTEQAFEYLDEAEKATDNPLTVDLTRSELWIKLEQNDKAKNLLNRILKSYPNNPRAVFLMTQASHNSGDWQNLRNILPKASKLELLPGEKLNQMSFVSVQNQLKSAESSQQLSDYWSQLSSAEKIQADNVITLAECANRFNTPKVAQKYVEKSLSQNLNHDLLNQWSRFSLDAHGKIKTAEKWLKTNQNDPQMLRVLGEMCMKQQLWGKTQSYLEQSLEIQPDKKTYQLLAEYFDAIQETDNALEAYRQAGKINHSNLIVFEEKDKET